MRGDTHRLKKQFLNGDRMKILEKNLDIVRDLLRRDMDFFCVVDGYEGSGKSTLALEICDYVDDDFNLNKVAFTGDEFIRVLRNAKPYSAVLLDEGGTVLFSRSAMQEMNKRIVELLMTVRAKNIFFCLCLPNIFWLDVYARKHRVGALIHITKRGRFAFYSKRRIGEMLKENNYGKANFYDSFSSLDGNELWDQYQKKKHAFVDDQLEKRMEISDEEYFSTKDAAKWAGCPTRRVFDWIKIGIGGRDHLNKLPAVRTPGGRYYIKKDVFFNWWENVYLPRIERANEIRRGALKKWYGGRVARKRP